MTRTIEVAGSGKLRVPPRNFRERAQKEQEERSQLPLGLDEWANHFTYNGLAYPFGLKQTLGGKEEEIPADFAGLVQGAYRENGVVFACMMARRLLFSEARFQFRRLRNNQPTDELFGNRDLAILEKPWPGAKTGKLLSRMITDVDLAGSSFITRRGNNLRRLRPDWVTIVLGSEDDPEVEAGDIDAEILGYIYHPGGMGGGRDPEVLLREQVAMFTDAEDPLASYRGMSWLTPVIREIMGDKAMTSHKLKFFENGAPQPLDAGVLTPSGWKTMGEIEVGDEVIGSDGRGHDVLDVYPQGERDIYRVKFSDGAATECTADHLWNVANAYDRKLGRTRTLPLGEIFDAGACYESGAARWSVAFPDPVEFDDPGGRPVEPYLLGVLLGDGSFRGNGQGSGGVSLCAAAGDADETEGMLDPLLPVGTRFSRRDRGGWSELYIRGRGGPAPNQMTAAVKDLELFDVLGGDKFIPDGYLRGSIADRVAVLQGLIDSDGHIEGTPVSFTTTSPKLAAQMCELVRSLGGSASSSLDRSRSTIRVRIRRLPDWIIPCRLARKVAAYLPIQKGGRYRYIETIEYVGRKEAQCISVASEDNLYVTDDYILTHNTPNLVVSLDPKVKLDDYQKWVEAFTAKSEGLANAYKTLYLGGGADATVVGANLRQLDFKMTQGAAETRIAVAARIPPVIVGLSEGLEAATYSNYGQARRAFADLTMRPLWRDGCAALETIIPTPADAELWYSERHISFLQEDRKDDSDIQYRQAQTIRTLIDSGYEAATVIEAVRSGDWSRLAHSGLFSVQLQKPGTTNSQPNGAAASDEEAARAIAELAERS